MAPDELDDLGLGDQARPLAPEVTPTVLAPPNPSVLQHRTWLVWLLAIKKRGLVGFLAGLVAIKKRGLVGFCWLAFGWLSCAQACGCNITTPRYACNLPRSCVSAMRAKKNGTKPAKPAKLS